MQNLQFCQQCQVYHNVSFLRGQRVLTQCERKINQTYPTEENVSRHQPVFFSKQEPSPASRASSTSIYHHFQPVHSRQNQNHLNFPPPHIEVKMVQSTIQRHPQFNLPPQNQQQNNSVKINFLPPPQNPYNQQVVQLNPVIPQQQKYKVGGLLQMPVAKSMLSTIKQEGPDESQRSRSAMSISNVPISFSRPQSMDQRFSSGYQNNYLTGNKLNFQKDQVIEQIPIIVKKSQKQDPYVFKSFQKSYQFRSMKKSMLDQDDENQSSCWCW